MKKTIVLIMFCACSYMGFAQQTDTNPSLGRVFFSSGGGNSNLNPVSIGEPFAGATTNISTFGSQQTAFYPPSWQGISNIQKTNNKFSLFPNPATTTIKVQVSGSSENDYTIKIINYLGQEVFIKQHISKIAQISIADLSQGVYAVIYCDNDGAIIHTDKIVKQ